MTGMMDFLETGTLPTFDIAGIIGWLLGSLGHFMIFRKCGVKPAYAFIPVAREYHGSLCADKEKEGRTFAIINAVEVLFTILYFLTEDSSSSYAALIAILVLASALADVLYQVRIYSGLCQAFGRSKKWLWGWFFMSKIIALIWGIGESFQPVKQVEKIDADIRVLKAKQEVGVS